MSAPLKNQNAAKAIKDKAESSLIIRCKTKDKASWVRAADGQKLTAWVVEALNERADGYPAIKLAVIAAAVQQLPKK